MIISNNTVKNIFNTIYKLLLDVFHSFIICFTAFLIAPIFFNSYNNVQTCLYMWCVHVYFASYLIFSVQSFKSSTMENIFEFSGWIYWKGNIQHSNNLFFKLNIFFVNFYLQPQFLVSLGYFFSYKQHTSNKVKYWYSNQNTNCQ